MRSTRRYVDTGSRGGVLTHGRMRSNVIYKLMALFGSREPARSDTVRGARRERAYYGRAAAPSERAREGYKRSPEGNRQDAGFVVRAAAFIAAALSAARGDGEASALRRRLGALMCAVVLVCGLACVTLPSFMNMGRVSVSLDIDGAAVHIDTFDETVGDLLARYAITLGEGDMLYPPASARLEDDMSIRLRRAMSVSVEVDGQTRRLNLLSGTVDDALRAAGIAYTDADELSYSKHAKLQPGMLISLVRVDTEHEFETQVMPFRIKYEDDAALPKGEEKITQRGIEGKKEIQYRLTYKDGVLVSREAVGERVIEAPRSRIVSVGTKVAAKPAATSSGKVETASAKPTASPKSDSSLPTFKVDGKSYSYKESLRMEVTAYTHTGRKTATGTWPKRGTIAVDKSVIPLGTKLYVKGYGFGVASDVGVRGQQVDVFMETYEECIKWGRKRNVRVYILPK